MKTTGYHKAEDWMDRIACQPESLVRRGEILERESLTVLRDRPEGHHPRDADLNQTDGVASTSRRTAFANIPQERRPDSD